ncbi:hypothetical protein ABK040_013000 [Willaertia magna]
MFKLALSELLAEQQKQQLHTKEEREEGKLVEGKENNNTSLDFNQSPSVESNNMKKLMDILNESTDAENNNNNRDIVPEVTVTNTPERLLNKAEVQSSENSERFSFTVFSTFSNRNYKIFIKKKDSSKLKIKKIKQNLEKVVKISASDIVLYLNDKLLDDEMVGQEFGLGENTIITLVQASEKETFESLLNKPTLTNGSIGDSGIIPSPVKVESSPMTIPQKDLEKDSLITEDTTSKKSAIRKVLLSNNKNKELVNTPKQIQKTLPVDTLGGGVLPPFLTPPTQQSILGSNIKPVAFTNSQNNISLEETVGNQSAEKKETSSNLNVSNYLSNYAKSSLMSPTSEEMVSPLLKRSSIEVNEVVSKLEMKQLESELDFLKRKLEKQYQTLIQDEKNKISRKFATEKKEILQRANDDRQELSKENTRLRKELLAMSNKLEEHQQNQSANQVVQNSKEITDLKCQIEELEAKLKQKENEINEMEGKYELIKKQYEQDLETRQMKFEVEKQNLWNQEKEQMLKNWAEEVESLEIKNQQEKEESKNTCDMLKRELDLAHIKIEKDLQYVESADLAFNDLRNQITLLTNGDVDASTLIIESAKEKALLEKKYNEIMRDYDVLREQLEEEVKKRKSLHNLVEDMKGNIRVIVRIRPLLEGEQQTDVMQGGRIEVKDENMISVQSQNLGLKNLEFFKVLGESSDQLQVFEQVQPLIQSAIDGFNVCVFAYGQTGSGKTFTIHGEPENINQFGLIPRALDHLFKCLERQICHKTESFTLSCSMVELYLDDLIDLYENIQDQNNNNNSTTTGKKKLQLRQSENGKMSVTNCVEIPVNNSNELMQLLKYGNESKKIFKTEMNDQSSRSHTIFTVKLTIQGRESNNQEKYYRKQSKIAFVDLAGSERVTKSGSVKSEERFKEAQHINKSLSALGDVIAALSTKQKHVPYRNSKLTLMLQEMIGGNSKTIMFANISPDRKSISETISTLTFASRVKCVQNHPLLSKQTLEN